MLAFTEALADRLATMKGVALTVEAGEPVTVEARPFVLENLLWFCLQQLFTAAGSGTTVALAAEAEGTTALVRIRCAAGTKVNAAATEVEPAGRPLLAELQAQLGVAPTGDALLLRRPVRRVG